MELAKLIERHARTGILLDANVLLLSLIGTASEGLVSTFKRTNRYTIDDYRLLTRLLTRFSRVITTPWVLSEVSNLAGQLGEPNRREFFLKARDEIILLDERYLPSSEAVDVEFFPSLGLVDAAIYLVARSGLMVLTDDYRLAGKLEHAGVDVINFSSIRPIAFP